MGGVIGPQQDQLVLGRTRWQAPTTTTKGRAVPRSTEPGRKGTPGAVGLEHLPQIVSIVRGGGREGGRAPFPAPACGPPPAPAPPPAPPPPRLSPAAAPSSRSWCRGAAEPHVAVSMASDPSAKVREAGECGRWQGRGPRPGKAWSTSIPPSKLGQALLTAETPGPA